VIAIDHWSRWPVRETGPGRGPFGEGERKIHCWYSFGFTTQRPTTDVLVTLRSSRFHGKDTRRDVYPTFLPPRLILWRVLLRRVSLNLSAHKSRRVTLLRAVRHWSANDVPRAPGSESVYELRSAHEGERNATIRMRYTASRCRNVNIATADSNGFYLGSCQGLAPFSFIFRHLSTQSGDLFLTQILFRDFIGIGISEIMF